MRLYVRIAARIHFLVEIGVKEAVIGFLPDKYVHFVAKFWIVRRNPVTELRHHGVDENLALRGDGAAGILDGSIFGNAGPLHRDAGEIDFYLARDHVAFLAEWTELSTGTP